jgi:hypothetical protein
MPNDNTYKRHGLEFLKCTFPRLSVRAIEKTFKIEYNFTFTPSFNALRDVRAVIPIDHVGGEDAVLRARILEVAPFLHTVNQIVIKHERQVNRLPRKLDRRLVQEMSRIDELKEGKESILPSKGQPKEAEEDDVHDGGEGKTLECGCCMDDILVTQMVHCNVIPLNNSHSFCKNCLRLHISEQLYGKNQARVPCMSINGCTSTFGDDKFDAVLSPRTLKNYNVLRAQEAAKAAGIDLWYVYASHYWTRMFIPG